VGTYIAFPGPGFSCLMMIMGETRSRPRQIIRFAHVYVLYCTYIPPPAHAVGNTQGKDPYTRSEAEQGQGEFMEPTFMYEGTTHIHMEKPHGRVYANASSLEPTITSLPFTTT